MSQLQKMKQQKALADKQHAEKSAQLDAQLKEAERKASVSQIVALQAAAVLADRDDQNGVSRITSWERVSAEFVDKGIIPDGVSGEAIRNAWRNHTKKFLNKALSTDDRIFLNDHDVPYLASAACDLGALGMGSFEELDTAIKSAGVPRGLRSKAFGFRSRALKWLGDLSPSDRIVVADAAKSGIKMCQVHGLFHFVSHSTQYKSAACLTVMPPRDSNLYPSHFTTRIEPVPNRRMTTTRLSWLRVATTNSSRSTTWEREGAHHVHPGRGRRGLRSCIKVSRARIKVF